VIDYTCRVCWALDTLDLIDRDSCGVAKDHMRSDPMAMLLLAWRVAAAPCQGVDPIPATEPPPGGPIQSWPEGVDAPSDLPDP
jgi:hypothetical protein